MFLKIIGKLSRWMNTFAGVILFLMMMLTVVDVVLRALGRPLVGTYEIVAMAGALVTGFAIAQTAWDKGHISVDFLIEHRSPTTKKIILIFTRLFGIVLCAFISMQLYLKGIHFYKSGEVSLTLHIPHHPPAYALAFGFIIVCFVLVADIVKLFVNEEDRHE